MLDYDDVPEPDPEPVIAVASIPPLEDIEMLDAEPAPVTAATFQLELDRFGYDPNFAQNTGDTGPGSTSPVTPQEDNLLSTSAQTEAPGVGWLGLLENTGHPIMKSK